MSNQHNISKETLDKLKKQIVSFEKENNTRDVVGRRLWNHLKAGAGKSNDFEIQKQMLKGGKYNYIEGDGYCYQETDYETFIKDEKYTKGPTSFFDFVHETIEGGEEQCLENDEEKNNFKEKVSRFLTKIYVDLLLSGDFQYGTSSAGTEDPKLINNWLSTVDRLSTKYEDIKQQIQDGVKDVIELTDNESFPERIKAGLENIMKSKHFDRKYLEYLPKEYRPPEEKKKTSCVIL